MSLYLVGSYAKLNYHWGAQPLWAAGGGGETGINDGLLCISYEAPVASFAAAKRLPVATGLLLRGTEGRVSPVYPRCLGERVFSLEGVPQR